MKNKSHFLKKSHLYQIDQVQNSWLKNSEIFFRLPHLIYSCLLSAASTLPTMVGITKFTISCLFLLKETDCHWLGWKWQLFHGFLDKNLKFGHCVSSTWWTLQNDTTNERWRKMKAFWLKPTQDNYTILGLN